MTHVTLIVKMQWRIITGAKRDRTTKASQQRIDVIRGESEYFQNFDIVRSKSVI